MLNLETKEVRMKDSKIKLLNIEKNQYKLKLELPNQIFHLENNKYKIILNEKEINFSVENAILKLAIQNATIEKIDFQQSDIPYLKLYTLEDKYLMENLEILFDKSTNFAKKEFLKKLAQVNLFHNLNTSVLL